MTKIFALPLLALAFVATPALAQDGGRQTWDGFYIGGSVGAAVQDNDIVNSRILFDRDLNGSFGDTVTTAAGADAFSAGFCNGFATSSANSDCSNDRDGVEYMVRVGADTQNGPLVIGVVGEFGRAEVTDSVSAFSTTPASYTLSRNLRYNANIRGRVGYAPNGMGALFYAAGGPSYGRIRNYINTSNTTNSFAVSGENDVYGYNAGGGAEIMLLDNVSFGLEYLYTDLKDRNSRVRVGRGTAPATNPFILGGAAGTDFRRSDTHFRWHSIRATLAFRF